MKENTEASLQVGKKFDGRNRACMKLCAKFSPSLPKPFCEFSFSFSFRVTPGPRPKARHMQK